MALKSVPLEATLFNKRNVNIPGQSTSYLDIPENALLPLPFTSNTQSRPSHFLFLASSLMDLLAGYNRITFQGFHYTCAAFSGKSCFFPFSRFLYFCEQSAYFLVRKTALFLSVFSSVNISREMIVCQELNYSLAYGQFLHTTFSVMISAATIITRQQNCA